VKPDERTPPNPLLAHLRHRDIETKDGMKLTLMNPAYMMRQMTEEFEELYGVKGSITGQILLDPEGKRNKPDDWELEALKKFDQGFTEVVEITQINGSSYLRLMRPMLMKAGCVACHGHLGFKEGDIRGGVSVSLPMAPFEKAEKSSANNEIISHLTIWLLGVIVILYIEFIKQKKEEQHRQAKEIVNRTQKMDALGKLTGGIAHDYNNMLAVIQGYSDLLKIALSEQPKLAKYAHEIHHASERGAKLTKKLLSFSRKKSSNVERININTLLLDQQHMLEKTLTARIKLVLDLQDNLWPVYLDSSELEDTVINMSINAMHAIEGNGSLTLKTSNEHIKTMDAESLGLKPGDYVLLNITDTGCGMDEVTKTRIFEPFYTTKAEKGTGLGMSQVYGFMERCEGVIKLYSEVGHGSQFVLYFPRCSKNDRDTESTEKNHSIANSGNETILVVDDEPALLDLTSEILSAQGYRVMGAQSGEEALDILAAESIDLMLSDIIMPDMNGYYLAGIAQKKYPDLKIQLASGFADERHKDMVDDALSKNMLHKPFNSGTLLQKIRSLLDDEKVQIES